MKKRIVIGLVILIVSSCAITNMFPQSPKTDIVVKPTSTSVLSKVKETSTAPLPSNTPAPTSTKRAENTATKTVVIATKVPIITPVSDTYASELTYRAEAARHLLVINKGLTTLGALFSSVSDSPTLMTNQVWKNSVYELLVMVDEELTYFDQVSPPPAFRGTNAFMIEAHKQWKCVAVYTKLGVEGTSISMLLQAVQCINQFSNYITLASAALPK